MGFLASEIIFKIVITMPIILDNHNESSLPLNKNTSLHMDKMASKSQQRNMYEMMIFILRAV